MQPLRPGFEVEQADFVLLCTRADELKLAQGVNLDDLTPQRILFGFFPTYRSSPLQPAFDRVLQARCCRGRPSSRSSCLESTLVFWDAVDSSQSVHVAPPFYSGVKVGIRLRVARQGHALACAL